MSPPPLLSVRDLTVSFARGGRRGLAVSRVSFDIDRNGGLAIVGESGSGKSVLVRAALGLLAGTSARVEGGAALLDGVDLLRLPPSALEGIRGRRVAMIFQEPAAALNPLLTAGFQVAEAMEAAEPSAAARLRRAASLFAECGIREPRRAVAAYPHELSGGEKQRVTIACALAPGPELLVADEPTTALDVTVQARVLALIDRLRRERGLALVLITHALAVAARRAERLLVLYGGREAERGPTERVLARPAHPYTRALLAALPTVAERRMPRPIPGSVPSIFDDAPGCRFAPRCALALDACRAEEPAPVEVAPGHVARCLRAREAV